MDGKKEAKDTDDWLPEEFSTFLPVHFRPFISSPLPARVFRHYIIFIEDQSNKNIFSNIEGAAAADEEL